MLHSTTDSPTAATRDYLFESNSENKWLKVQYRDNDSPACAVKNTKKCIVETTGDNLQMKAVAKYFLSFDLNWFRKIIQYRL